MTLDKLKIGMKIKNYKELCILIEEKEKTSNSKKSQLRELSRYVKFHKIGNSFIIDEIYDVPQEKIDLRNLGGMYQKDIQPLILDLVATQGECCFSCGKLLEELNMVNENFSLGRNNIEKFSKILNVEESILYDFYYFTQSNLKSILISALNNLQNNRRLIFWRNNYEIGLKVGKKTYYRRATDDEIDIITGCSREALIHFNYDSLNVLIKDGKYKSYKKYEYSLLEKEIKNFTFYYLSFEIRHNPKYTILALEEEEKEARQRELNLNILDANIKSIKTKHDNAVKKYNNNWGDISLISVKNTDFNRISNENKYMKVSKKTIDREEKIFVELKEEDNIIYY